MTPDQIRGLREFYRLTQTEFSKITGLGEATVSRWERGSVIQNKAYDYYLYLLGYKENLQRIIDRSQSRDGLERPVEARHEPTFRELDMTNELLERSRIFKLVA
jgi:transcriptional regulator with XRE-family HTH domain